MSSATQIEMSTPGAENAPAAVAQLAKAIAKAETSMMDHIAELKFIDVQRDFRTCGASVPATVRISIQMRMPFAILGGQSCSGQVISDTTISSFSAIVRS